MIDKEDELFSVLEDPKFFSKNDGRGMEREF